MGSAVQSGWGRKRGLLVAGGEERTGQCVISCGRSVVCGGIGLVWARLLAMELLSREGCARCHKKVVRENVLCGAICVPFVPLYEY